MHFRRLNFIKSINDVFEKTAWTGDRVKIVEFLNIGRNMLLDNLVISAWQNSPGAVQESALNEVSGTTNPDNLL